MQSRAKWLFSNCNNQWCTRQTGNLKGSSIKNTFSLSSCFTSWDPARIPVWIKRNRTVEWCATRRASLPGTSAFPEIPAGNLRENMHVHSLQDSWPVLLPLSLWAVGSKAKSPQGSNWQMSLTRRRGLAWRANPPTDEISYLFRRRSLFYSLRASLLITPAGNSG